MLNRCWSWYQNSGKAISNFGRFPQHYFTANDWASINLQSTLFRKENLFVEWEAKYCIDWSILSTPLTVLQLLKAHVRRGKSCTVHVDATKGRKINLGLLVDWRSLSGLIVSQSTPSHLSGIIYLFLKINWSDMRCDFVQMKNKSSCQILTSHMITLCIAAGLQWG